MVSLDRFKWWTRTHSYFVLMGGFALQDDEGTREIRFDTFLSLVDAGDIVNPVVTKDEIKDKSTSDALAKAILIVQLSWFVTQVAARLINHLAVTLVELDTVCMALFTFPLIFFWWRKPCCPQYPHIFYKRNASKSNIKMSQQDGDLSELPVGIDSYYSNCKNSALALIYVDSTV